VVESAPDAPFCFFVRTTSERGRKGPVGGENLEATVSGAHNSFIDHTQARRVGYEMD